MELTEGRLDAATLENGKPWIRVGPKAGLLAGKLGYDSPQ
jgi:hypothetical protein